MSNESASLLRITASIASSSGIVTVTCMPGSAPSAPSTSAVTV